MRKKAIKDLTFWEIVPKRLTGYIGPLDESHFYMATFTTVLIPPSVYQIKYKTVAYQTAPRKVVQLLKDKEIKS